MPEFRLNFWVKLCPSQFVANRLSELKSALLNLANAPLLIVAVSFLSNRLLLVKANKGFC